MEALLENAQEVKGKLGEKINANKDQGILSKELATILLDVPVTFDAENYALRDPNQSKVSELFQELEFRRMAENFNKIFTSKEEPVISDDKINTSNQKVLQEGQQFDLFSPPGSGSSAQNDSLKRKDLSTKEHWYQTVNSKKARELLLKKL